MFDVRTAQDALEDALRDAILYALGKRQIAATSIAELRAYATTGASGASTMHDDMLAAVTVAGSTSGYRWNTQSTAPDDGVDVIQPSDVTANGRWLKYTSPLRFAPTVGGNSYYLHELTSGPLKRVILLDRAMSDEETLTLVLAQMPLVLIQASEDTSRVMTSPTGLQARVDYSVAISVIAENFRDRRQAQQGSTFPGEMTPGANGLDGFIQYLLTGTQLAQVASGILDVRPGHARNETSKLAQRRVERMREYEILAQVDFPPAPNDSAALTEIDVQAHSVDLDDQPSWSGVYVSSGLTVTPGAGLTKMITAGSLVVNGATISYAGQLYTFAADAVTYRDLNPDGTLTLTVVGLGANQPPTAASSTRIGATTTNASGVVADRLIASSSAAYGSRMQVPL